MASRDPAPGERAAEDIADAQQRPVMQLQVVLERLGFGPGVIDGSMGMSTENALSGFQEANGLQVTGEYDDATRQALSRWTNIPATRVVTIPEDWGQLTFAAMPEGPAEQAKMDHLGYESMDEKLAERFHTTIEVLHQLNPGGKPATATAANTAAAGAGGSATAGSALATGGQATAQGNADAAARGDAAAADQAAAPMFRAGQQIRVPNVGADRINPADVEDATWRETLVSLGVGSEQPKAARIVVDKSGGWLKAYDSADKLIAMFTVTTGSQHDPLPLGEWGIKGVAHNPPFAYNPDLFWDASNSESKQQLPPGPNGPVGVVWIDLTKEHYGIHGTGAPETIGRAQSHGCVRLTNWDAARLAQMVDGSTKVLFQA